MQNFQTELSQNLQLLSEKALALTEYIQRVKKLSEKVNVCITILFEFFNAYN